MMKKTPGLFFVFFMALGLAVQGAQASQETGEKDDGQESSYRFFLNVKGAWHTFWSAGLFEHGAEYGRPGLGANDMQGLGGEVDLDFQFRHYLVFTATVGAYEGSANQYDIDVITAYGLLTAKLQNVGNMADYYVGLGLGGYFSRMSADGTSYTFKPGAHGLVGIRFHLTPSWDLLLEDRLAFTLRAKGGFGDLDLGGNFVLLGCSYRF